jgi:hypothetical protein
VRFLTRSTGALEGDGQPKGLRGTEVGQFSWGCVGWIEESWCTWIVVSVEIPLMD